MTNQLSWINETKEQQEEVVHPTWSINQAFDFLEENNEYLLDYFISKPNIYEQLRNMQYIITYQVLGQYFQENCTIDSLETAFDDIFLFNPLQMLKAKPLRSVLENT